MQLAFRSAHKDRKYSSGRDFGPARQSQAQGRAARRPPVNKIRQALKVTSEAIARPGR